LGPVLQLQPFESNQVWGIVDGEDDLLTAGEDRGRFQLAVGGEPLRTGSRRRQAQDQEGQNPSPQPPPRSGEGAKDRLCSPSPLRGGGWGEGLSPTGFRAAHGSLAPLRAPSAGPGRQNRLRPDPAWLPPPWRA